MNISEHNWNFRNSNGMGTCIMHDLILCNVSPPSGARTGIVPTDMHWTPVPRTGQSGCLLSPKHRIEWQCKKQNQVEEIKSTSSRLIGKERRLTMQTHKDRTQASLVAQWIRIRLPMQETQVRSLVREDPTCRGATKPVRHNYWACALEPVLRSKRSHRNEKPAHRN